MTNSKFENSKRPRLTKSPLNGTISSHISEHAIPMLKLRDVLEKNDES
jgi:hypothetical protein